jgi:muramoyltetrapeptide carboxypeptidase LdcA involved in peptidoglycan recycling
VSIISLIDSLIISNTQFHLIRSNPGTILGYSKFTNFLLLIHRDFLPIVLFEIVYKEGIEIYLFKYL